MTLRLAKRGRYWHATGTHMGVEVRRSLKTTRKAAAERLLSTIVAEIEADAASGGRRRKTFKEAVLDYKSKGGRYKGEILGRQDPDTGLYDRLLGAFGDRPADSITEDDLLAYCRANHAAAKPATWNRHVIAPVKAVLRANRIPNWQEIDKLREERVETPFADPDYLSRALAAFEGLPHLQAIVLTMATTGRRVGECIAWRREQVDWERGLVAVDKAKNGDPITVRIPATVLPILKALPEFENGRLFGYETNTSLAPSMRRRCAKAGIPYLSPHRIGRHTFASWSIRYHGMSVKHVQQAGGWKSLGAVEHYMHLAPSEAQVASAAAMDGNPTIRRIASSAAAGRREKDES